MTELPYYPDVKGAPQNSIIGGASLWVMGGKKPEEYKGIAKFFTYPVAAPTCRRAGTRRPATCRSPRRPTRRPRTSGFYEKNPDARSPLMQLTGKPPTENSRGLRLGNLVQIRDVIAEDLEAAFAGKRDAQAALDDAVKRGNAILRQFEKTAK